ncbi:hypothetical protein EXIGLDRAFT_838086 [Exidia glandulosa HHB12029]|uniref:Domain of unknown function at the cortex 1 domain-containing protein n=1 Tax=Exidia glandulosa HHB12029 TaxID=1314781 RepID=A0A165G6P8_EXIGL|nr:hypothetical protein EXIGLDRAFT_838086 [Exidia glandulosa HHB12029]
MPRLRVFVGSSSDNLQPIEVNQPAGSAYPVSSDAFEGRIAVFLRYEDEPHDREAANYFRAPERENVTWSIQVQGRFLQPRQSDTILFGNTFDHSLKLPYGTGAILKFMNVVDPTLEQDLQGDQPWALFPFLCTMPHLHHTKVDASAPPSSWPSFPPTEPLSHNDESCSELGAPQADGDRSKRRDFFARHGVETTIGPEDLFTGDFCHGRLSFPSLALKIPGGIKLDLKKHWERAGQRVYFVCCERRSEDGEGSIDGPGRTFWCVAFELDDESDAEGET